MVDRLKVHVRGRVQGVGFRYATAREAESRGLNGWVRNLADGSVEAEFEGVRADLESMLEWCRVGPSFARVNEVDMQWSRGEPRFKSFEIR